MQDIINAQRKCWCPLDGLGLDLEILEAEKYDIHIHNVELLIMKLRSIFGSNVQNIVTGLNMILINAEDFHFEHDYSRFIETFPNTLTVEEYSEYISLIDKFYTEFKINDAQFIGLLKSDPFTAVFVSKD